MTIKIEIPVMLRRYAGRKKYIKSDLGKLDDILNDLKKEYPDLSKKIFDHNARLKSYVIVFVDGKEIEKAKIYNIEIHDGQLISFVLAIAGG